MSYLLELAGWVGFGFAFSFGAAMGGVCVAVLLRYDRRKNPTDAASLKLLAERNAIGERQAEALEDIATQLCKGGDS